MMSQRILEAVARYRRRLPARLEAFQGLMAILDHPASNYDRVVAGLPPALALEFLERANRRTVSGREVRSLHHALQLLGYGEIRRLLMEAAGRWEAPDLPADFSLARFQRQAHLAAAVARILGMVVDYERLGDLVTTGLLQNIGKLVIAVELRDEFRRIRQLKLARGCPSAEAERQVLGFSHADVGALVLRQCGLPAPICEAVQRHNARSVSDAGGALDPLPLITHRATRIVRDLSLPEGGSPLERAAGLVEAVPRLRGAYRSRLASALRQEGFQRVFPQVMEALAADLQRELEERLTPRPISRPADASDL
jgi:hypothetical protein